MRRLTEPRLRPLLLVGLGVAAVAAAEAACWVGAGAALGGRARPRLPLAAAPSWMESLMQPGGDEVEVPLPASTEDAVRSLRESLDAAIERKLPRLDVELPKGLQLGVEGIDELWEPPAEPTKEQLDLGDRELAASILLYFGESPDLCVFFRTAGQANAAKRGWKTWGSSHILSFQKGSKTSFAGGGAERGAGWLLKTVEEKKCQTLAFVAPRAEQLKAIREMDEALGLDNPVRIILLNARLRSLAKKDEDRERAAAAFNPVFHARLAGPGRNGLVYRAMVAKGPAPWIMARRGPPGEAPKEVSREQDPPSASSVKAAFAR